MSRFQVPKGTFDVLPAEQAVRERIETAARGLFTRAGYGRIETPAFEDSELFARGVGEATNIVRKEMFSFEDKGGRSVTLRPEGTAPICRAYVEQGMHKLAQPVKLWYQGPFFRYEAPQAGRFRQFNQIGAEALGSDSPLVDVESIMLLDDLLRELGVPGVELRLGSLGSQAARAAYREELKAYLREHEAELSRDVRERIDANPLRAFDADDEDTQAVMATAPTMLDRLDGEDAEHFAEVRSLLDSAGVEYRLDGTLVRGLDYYTRTIFEFNCDRLGAQSGIGGGGRYDGLVEQLGGPPTAAIGWAAGVERIVLALDAPAPAASSDVFVVAPETERRRAMALVVELRRSGLVADADMAGRSIKGQLKHADRVGARHAVILEEDGAAQLRDMGRGEQRPVDVATVAEELAAEPGDD
ncbi:MAG: histidyl-tRNA synthetase [Solirubrobacterales bacterium]|jgi:histidyl-tRNA synthetase|nr:histidyl-tRNA synthetase [Solirubrobacterales bacterium]